MTVLDHASARFRSGRWAEFAARFPDLSAMRVLDLGGTPAFWMHAPARPAGLTIVNLFPLVADDPSIEVLRGDACDPPPLPGGYDLVISNSLLEHVGGHTRRAMLADIIHGSGSRHWIQTPYRYFPIEPHWMFPGLQFLPFSARVALTQKWKLGNRYATDRQAAIDSVNEIELIGLAQMRSYFPDSDIWFERLGGLRKSMVAIRI